MTIDDAIQIARKRAGLPKVAEDGAEQADDRLIAQECEHKISVDFLQEVLRFQVEATSEDERLRFPRDVSHIERVYYNNLDITAHRVNPSEIQFGV